MAQKNELFQYNIEDAVAVIWDNIDEMIKNKFSYEDVYRIVEIENEILTELGINVPDDDFGNEFDIPIEVDWDKVKSDMICRLELESIRISMEEIDDILDAELLYYELNGALRDAGEYLN
jgi:hypothetical protein